MVLLLLFYSNIAERLRRRRSSHDVSMNVYPGDLLVQEHHKKLIKRNTISDFYAGRNGSTPALSEGRFVILVFHLYTT